MYGETGSLVDVSVTDQYPVIGLVTRLCRFVLKLTSYKLNGPINIY